MGHTSVGTAVVVAAAFVVFYHVGVHKNHSSISPILKYDYAVNNFRH
jgi:hypothetical protein